MTDEPKRVDPRAMHRCIKCGREIGPDESMCDVCNHAGMATPSASQYHGTMAVAIIAGVVALAIWASLAMRGVGPYTAQVVEIQPAPPAAIDVTLEIENEGTSRGYAKCQLQALDAGDRVLRVQPMSAGPLQGGERRTFTERFPGLSELPSRVVVACS